MKDKKVYIIAGENSGDFIGAKLIQQMQSHGAKYTIKGIGGPLMEEQGLISLFPMAKIAIMGLIEVISRIFTIKKLMNNTINDIIDFNPNMLITIDSLGFNGRIAKIIKQKLPNTVLVHYVAPTVWAWKPKRAKKLAELYHYLLCLFDFEVPYFTKHGLPTYCVGHPIIESKADKGNGQNLATTYNLSNGKPYILVMPGSRISEIERLLPIFSQAVDNIKKIHPNIEVIIPCVPHLIDYVKNYLLKNNCNWLVISSVQDKYDSFALAKMAIVASGTATLELALAKVPSIVAYRVNPITAFLGYMLIKVKYASVVNIIANKEIIQEFIQKKCTIKNITEASLQLLNSNMYPKEHHEKISTILTNLGYNNFIPSERAYEIINTILEKNNN